MHIKGDQRCSGTAASAMSLRVVSARIAAGEVTPVEHVDEVLESLDSLAGTPWANLVSARNDDRARREAELHTARIASGRGRGPLDGIAVAGEGQYRRRRHADGSWQRLRRRPRCRQPRRRHRDAAARAGSDCRCENSPARTCLRVNKIDQRERASTKPPRSRSDNRRQSVGICCADRTRCGSTSDRNGHRLQCSGPGGTVWGSRAHACLGHAVQRGRSTGFAHL